MTDSNRVQRATEFDKQQPSYATQEMFEDGEHWIRRDEHERRMAAFADKEVAEAQRWIAVEEKLPEIGQWVLAWVYLPLNPVASAKVLAQCCHCNKDEPESYGEYRRTVGCWWANGRYYAQGHVTHWQPLPEPPAAAIRQRGSKSGGSDDE